MYKRILTFSRRPFVRNVAAVASGTAAAQAITMAFSPLITRLYGPEAYGIQGVFVSVVGVLGTIAAMSYPIAIVLPKSDADALSLARLSLYIGLSMSVLVAVLLFLYGFEILTLLNAQAISFLMYLIPIAMLISVVSRVVGQWLIREKAFSLTARVAVWQSLLINTIKAGLGLVHPTAAVLIVTNTLSGLLTAALMLLGLRKQRVTGAAEAKIPEPSLSAWAVAKQHRDFPLLRTPQELLNVISQSLPVVMLATYFGTAAVGFYSIASAVLAMPAGLIGSSVMQVFYPRINDAIHQGENAKTLIIQATAGLALIGALPFAAVIIAGPSLFEFVFGAEWRTAGVYAQWLSPWLFFQYINKPAVSAIPALRLQRGLLAYELFSTGSKLLALYLGYVVYESDVTAIALFSIFGVAAYAWLILWVISHSAKMTSEPQLIQD
jgi:O-antigen/teichoic acid export membrane protein